MTDANHVDQISGVSTTGHEWDDIRELNNPLPRWWLYTFYACIVWAFGYAIYYPAVPMLTTATEGLSGWHARTEVGEEVAKLRAMRGPMNDRIAKASLTEIQKDPELLSFARAEGAAAFATNCAPCHGAGGQGSKGYPNLHADRWIWGGSLEAIQQTITHGVRWDKDAETRTSLMPAFGRDGLIKEDQISQVADYVLSLSGRAPAGADLAKGMAVYADNCSACHGDDGKGNRDVGAPNLTTKIWLYGDSKAAIMERVRLGGGGVMPAWGDRLDIPTIKSLVVYVHGFGGGE